MRTNTTIGFALAALSLGGCDRWSHREFETAPTQKEAITIRADQPYSTDLRTDQCSRLQADLLEAQRRRAADPIDETNIIWLARRQGYLGMHHEAIATLSEGLTIHPDSYRLLRHRGHRFITIRQFERAVADLSRAARLAASHQDEVEPDGAPNALNIPRGTTKTNIFYHLALAHYLLGDFAAAEAAWRECVALAPNDDMRVAAAYWLHLTELHQGDSAGAAEALAGISPAMDVIENHDYHELLLMFQEGAAPESIELSPDGSVTQTTRGYGLAMLHYFNGDRAEARRLLTRIVESGNPAAFGAIAAEVELERMATSPE